MTAYLSIFFTLFVVLRCFFWLFAPPNPDEAYYWLWGQHLDFSYYDHPPLQVWLQSAITAWLGKSLFTLRSLHIFTNSIFFYTYYCILQYLYGDRAKRYIWWVILAIFASPVYNMMLSLAWHDHLAIALSLVGAYLCICFLDEYLVNGKGTSWRLYGSAIALSLAHITKYNSLFMTLALLVAIASHSQLRSLFRDMRLGLCVVISAIGFLPVFYWNYSNNFQSFRFYADRSINGGGTPIVQFSEPLAFIGLSLLMLSPFVAWLLWQAFRQSFGKQKILLAPKKELYQHIAFWTFAIPTGLLLVISFFSTALYYWNIHAYLLLFPLLPLALENHPDLYPSMIGTKGQDFKVFYGAQFFGLIFIALFVWNSYIFPISAMFGEDGDQDARMIYGWKEVAAEVQKISNTLPEPPLLITSDYRSAAALAYELHNPDVTAISKRISQFTIWNLENAAKQSGKNAILISDQWYPLTDVVTNHFDRVTPISNVEIYRFGVYLKTYDIAIAQNYKP